MIQLNLLPDVKLDYIKAERSRRMVLTVSILVTTVAVAILLLLLLVDLAQKKHLSDINKDIKSETSTLQKKPSISKILTVQNQLESLTNLHSAKPAASNLFNGYLDQITPAKIAIGDFNIDFNAHTVTISGTSDALSTINQYVDTLKFTTYTTADNANAKAKNAFSDVVLSSFGVSSTATDASQAATYSITLGYDPAIFDITKTIALKVPPEVTTRSQLAQPGDLFKVAPAKPSSTGGH